MTLDIGYNSDFGLNWPEDLDGTHEREIQPSTSEQTNAITSSDNVESVPDPQSWLFSPFRNHIVRRYQQRDIVTIDGPAGNRLDLGGFSACISEDSNLPSQAYLPGFSPRARPSINESRASSQPLTPRGGYDFMTYVGAFSFISYREGNQTQVICANGIPVWLLLAARPNTPALAASIARQ